MAAAQTNTIVNGTGADLAYDCHTILVSTHKIARRKKKYRWTAKKTKTPNRQTTTTTPLPIHPHSLNPLLVLFSLSLLPPLPYRHSDSCPITPFSLPAVYGFVI